jgi:hypothetical protein
MLSYSLFFLYLSCSFVKNGAVFDVTISCVCGYKNMDGQIFLKMQLSRPTNV